MASIWKHPKSPYWTACFRDANGKARRVTTRETLKSKARLIAQAFEKAARGAATRLHARAVINRLSEELGAEKASVVSLRTFSQTWLASKAPEVSPCTLAFYTATVKKFIAWLGERADSPLEEITKQDIISYRNALVSQVSARTANHDLRAVKMLLLAARRDGILEINPAEFVEGVRTRNSEHDEPVRRAFTIDELRAVLAQADGEWRSMILFGLYSGQRLSDIAALSWADVDLEKGELRFCTRKTGKRLILPIAAPLQQHLEQLPSSDDVQAPLHPRAARTLEQHGRVAALSNQFVNILADARLRPRTDHQKRAQGRSARRARNELSFHSLRKTATTLLHEAGVPQAVVQALIGHDSTEVHQLYIAIGREALVRAAASLPAL